MSASEAGVSTGASKQLKEAPDKKREPKRATASPESAAAGPELRSERAS
jgi:hypothetical protein